MLISIHIPDNSKCLLKHGADIDIGTPFLEFESTSLITIPLAQKINIPPKNIFKYIKKFVGETIAKGETLAIKKGFFSSTKIISEYDGIIKEIDHHSGHLIIDIKDGKKDRQLSYFKGEIANIDKNEIQIKVKNGKEFPIKKTTGDFGGKAIYIKNNDINSITSQCKNTIGIAESFNSYMQSKTEALGIDGYISLNSLPDSTDLPVAILKQINDLPKIMELRLPYCIVNQKKGTIVFYQ